MLKAMEKKPDDRYASMELLAQDLKKVTKGVTIERHVLASERKSLHEKLLIVMCFNLSLHCYFIMYRSGYRLYWTLLAQIMVAKK